MGMGMGMEGRSLPRLLTGFRELQLWGRHRFLTLHLTILRTLLAILFTLAWRYYCLSFGSNLMAQYFSFDREACKFPEATV